MSFVFWVNADRIDGNQDFFMSFQFLCKCEALLIIYLLKGAITSE